MNFNNKSIILDKTLLKEDLWIIKVFTRDHGIYSGVLKKSKKKQQPIPQKSDLIDFFWQARLIEHVGYCKIELIQSIFSYVMLEKKKIYSINAILDIINLSFQERDPHPILFDYLNNYLINLCKFPFSFTNHIFLEMNILTECGYHIDLTQCASTGSESNLIYVSPRSGKAVSREAGDKYKNSLLVLPEFILLGTEPKDRYEIDKANILIEYFLKRYLVNNQQTLNSRNIFYELIRSSL